MATLELDEDLDATLAQLAERPTGDIHIDHPSLIPALFMSERVHGLVPDAAALGVAALIGYLQWLWPPARRRAIGRMSLMLADTPRENEVRALARRQLVTHAVGNELKMRPWLQEKAHVSGREHVDEARASGRPVIVLMGHLNGTALAALPTDRPVYCVAHPFLSPDYPGTRAGWSGYQARLGWRRLRDGSLRPIFRGNAYRILDALLARGEVVIMSLDVPGSSRTTLAGKTAYVGSGIASLACERDALVLPLVGGIEKRRPVLRVGKPVDPRDFADRHALLDALAGLVGDAVVRAPERVDPNLYWREIWREHSGPYGIELWKRKRPVRDFRRRAQGKAALVRARIARSR